MLKRIESALMNMNWDRRKVSVSYFVLFVVMFVAFWVGYLRFGKGFIWIDDGLEQQYMFFMLEGEWLRDWCSNILNGTLTPPMWTDHVGYGADFIISCGITLGNPINLLSIFATSENAEFILQATVPLTLFLAGLSFLWLCRYLKFKPSYSLVASMVYVFGGYSSIAFMQIYLLYPLVLAPLAVLGVEKVFRDKNPLVLIVASALFMLSGPNHGYAMVILIFFYSLFRFFTLSEDRHVKQLLLWAVRILACIVVGMLISAVLFLPIGNNILSQGRVALDRKDYLLYPLLTYAKMYGGFVSEATVGSQCIFGFAPIALFCIIAAFYMARRPGSSGKLLPALFVLLSLFIALPFFGRMFNAFAYPSNRWVWAYCLLVSIIVAAYLPSLLGQKTRIQYIVLIGAGVYVAVGIALLYLGMGGQLVAYALVGLSMAYLIYVRRGGSYRVLPLIVMLIVYCCSNSIALSDARNVTQLNLGEAYELAVRDYPARILNECVSDGETERHEESVGKWPRDGMRRWRNGNIATGTIGTTFYNSLYNSNIDKYHDSLGLTSSSINFSYDGFAMRTPMELLAGTKYLVTSNSDSPSARTLFGKTIAADEIDGVKYAVLEADVTLPRAVLYRQAIEKSSYDQLNMAQRQEAMLQAIVLEDLDDKDSGAVVARSEDKDIEWSIAPANESERLEGDKGQKSNTLSISDNGTRFKVKKKGAVAYCNVVIPAGVEAYLCLRGCNFREEKQTELDSDIAGRMLELVNKIFHVSEEPAPYSIYVNKIPAITLKQTLRDSDLYSGKHDWAVRLGRYNEDQKGIALSFDRIGVYSFEDIELVFEDPAGVITDAATLAEDAPSEQYYDTQNRYHVSVEDAGEGSYLYFRMPYSTGWKARIDGEDAIVMRANLGFTAIRMPSGSHVVDLEYETPLLREGVILSLFGLAILGFTLLWKKGMLKRIRCRRQGKSYGS